MKPDDQPEYSLPDLYEQHTGKVSDKWASYLTLYDRLFASFRNRPIRLLEIGIQNGGSLEIWARYFKDVTAIIGCDIDEKCHALSYDHPNISVVVGNALSPAIRDKVTDICTQFDIIIDDGSHDSKDIIGAFNQYFPLLADGGIFVAEDLHCSYWKGYTGGLADKRSSIEFFKRLVDIANHAHWKEDWDLHAYLGLDPRGNPALTTDEILKVESVFFADSICSITKSGTIGPERLGKRIIAGKTAVVTENPEQYDGTYSEQHRRRKPSVLRRLMHR